MPTRRLIAVESTQATTVAVVLGSALALVLDVLGMLVARALLGDAASGLDGVGMGIVAVSATGIVILGSLSGYLSTARRRAPAAFYATLPPKDRRLGATLIVRGQVGPTPFGPAMTSTVALGSLALLAAIVCGVLAAEHINRLDDPLYRTEFEHWAVWTSTFLVLVLLYAGGVWWPWSSNRQWAETVADNLSPEILGHRGPAVRTTSREQRRAARSSWNALDWSSRIGGVLVTAGVCIVFLSVFLHQPGLYADPIRYTRSAENAIAAVTVIGGTALGVGIAIVIFAGTLSGVRTIRALRVPARDSESLSEDNRTLVRRATTILSDLATAAQAWWAASGLVAAGWWLAADPETANGAPLDDFWFTLLLVVWLLCGVLFFGARVLIQSVGPTVRNRFGYDLPTEADDRDYPDITLVGQ